MKITHLATLASLLTVVLLGCACGGEDEEVGTRREMLTAHTWKSARQKSTAPRTNRT